MSASVPDDVRLREDGVSWRAVDGHVVVLDLRTSEYLQVNEAGSLLFQHLAEGADRAQLSQALQEEYEVAAERADADVEAFLQMLAELDLLEQAGSQA